jgi:hypothetical protein
MHHMPTVTAPIHHDPVVVRTIMQSNSLSDQQRFKLSPQHNHWAVAIAEKTHNTMTADIRMNFEVF